MNGKFQTPKFQTPKDAGGAPKSHGEYLKFEVSLAFGRLGFSISPPS
jgi:hypothetical protein